MGLLYSFFIRLYAEIIRIAALFNPKAKAWIAGRKNFFEKLEQENFQNKNIHWFHCASLGEFDMALPLMQRIKQNDPSIFLLVSFFSPSGMEHYHKREHFVDLAIYLPIDTQANAQKFMQFFQPKVAYFVKYEFWANYIFEAKKAGVTVFSICTLLRENHRFFKWYGAFFRKTLKAIDFFYTQNETTSRLLQSIGLNNVLTIGDLRFDRVIENSQKVQRNERIEEFLSTEKAILFGSTWPQDEKIIAAYIAAHPERKFILAPHSIDEQHLASIEKIIPCIRYSAEEKNNCNVLLLNTIGHLSSAYNYGGIAYVGGGFSGKLHNILEPAVFGLPVIFGPKFERFPEARAFLEEGIGFSIKDLESMQTTIHAIEENLENLAEKTKRFVAKNQGAADAIYQDITTRFIF
jgi:3-deoxy-D-manno-octulosonic-acid transferase